MSIVCRNADYIAVRRGDLIRWQVYGNGNYMMKTTIGVFQKANKEGDTVEVILAPSIEKEHYTDPGHTYALMPRREVHVALFSETVRIINITLSLIIHKAAARIQRSWHRAIENSEYQMCRRRLLREYHEVAD